jgi:hypothetical protein
MTTATALPRFTCPAYVNLSDLLDALALTEEDRETFLEALGNWYTWGDTAYTLASDAGVKYWMEDTFPDHLPATRALLDGVDFVNLEG